MTSPGQPRSTFILGVGAPRSGSTWLYHYLKSCPSADLGFKKEYHVFDTVHLEDSTHFLPRDHQHVGNITGGFINKQSRQEQRLTQFRQNHANYFDYFVSLYSDVVSISADITPNYMGLPGELFSTINKEFNSRGVRVKVVFLIRDPVSRIISSARMAKKLGAFAGKRFDKNLGIDGIVQALCELPSVRRSIDYQATITNIESAFDPDDIYVGIYETLFTSKEIKKLSAFIGLEAKPELVKKKFNQTGLIQLDDELVEFSGEVLSLLRKQYAFCYKRFPALRELPAWQTNLFDEPDMIF